MDAVTLALDRAAIAALLPHQGAMCLLDGVLEHDEAHNV
jgi:predicted hotdog family 3-hydroxylacyl-ACP dehydratase